VSRPVFGEFRQLAGDHITAAVSYRGELPHIAHLGAVRHLDRLITTLGHYLADLPAQPHRPYGPEQGGSPGATAALVALDRAKQSWRPAATAAGDAGTGHDHPAVTHLSAAADHLAAGRDLLHTHFVTDPAGISVASSYWAPHVTCGPVTAALLAEVADCLHTLVPWIAAQARTGRVSPGTLTSAHRALHTARPWLQAAATAIEAAQRAHYPLPDRSLLDAIPANAPPPRQPSSPGESASESA
jgi:hypothetical protein